MSMDRFLGVFVIAFCRGKSVYHPYVPRRIGGLWVLEDGPGRRRPRKSEVIAHGLTPEQVVRRIRDGRVGWHFLCHAITPGEISGGELRSRYRALGYRSLGSEGMFAHRLTDIPEFVSNPPVRRIESAAQLDAMYSGEGRRRCWRDDARLYGIWDDRTDYGWVYSTPVERDAFVSDLFVGEECRRRGFGSALMSRLLRDDRDTGVEFSVLLASRAGTELYPRLGYQNLGTLEIFCPVRDRNGSR